MESMRHVLNGPIRKKSNIRRSRPDIYWAEFVLLKLVIFWLLALLSINTLCIPLVVFLAVTGRIGVLGVSIGVGTMIAGNLGCVGRLLNNSLKPILHIND
jgi:hypothetical protein